MEPRTNSLTDLSVFKFSEPTAQGFTNFAVMFGIFAVTVALTILFYHQWQRWRARRAVKRASGRVSSEFRFPRHLRELLAHLARISGHHDGAELVKDAWAFEHAVDHYYELDSAADMDSVSELRSQLHLNVTNPHLRTESTRQLVPDLPVRVLASVGEEALDLYCYVVNVNEMYLLIHIPEDKDVHAVLAADPRVRLVCWREHEGETLFRTRLEFVPTEGMALVHAKHAFRAEDKVQRSDFRLTVDFPLSWRYVERNSLAHLKPEHGHKLDVKTGQGRMVSLSYGGAAFSSPEPLAPGGLAQIQVSLDGHPVHAMLELIDRQKQADGAWLHRGRIRGITHEARNRVYSFLSSEQLTRLRERGLLPPAEHGQSPPKPAGTA